MTKSTSEWDEVRQVLPDHEFFTPLPLYLKLIKRADFRPHLMVTGGYEGADVTGFARPAPFEDLIEIPANAVERLDPQRVWVRVQRRKFQSINEKDDQVYYMITMMNVYFQCENISEAVLIKLKVGS